MAETFNQRLEQRAQQLLDAAIAELMTNQSGGHMSFETYKYTSGQIKGLLDAKTFIAQAHTDTMKS